MLRDAIRIYHDLLTDPLAAETAGMLEDQQRRRHLTFRDQLLCTSLRPRFLSPDHYRFLQTRVAILLGALNRCHEAALADAGFRRQFHLTPQENRSSPTTPASARRCRRRASTPSSTPTRSFASPNTMLKRPPAPSTATASPSSSTHAGHGAVLKPLPRHPSAERRPRDARPPRRLPPMVRRPPTAAHRYSRLKEVPTYSEFVLFQNLFQSNGLSCIIADPREVDIATAN